ncbi:hypothetical protein [Promicromonospora sp. MEB111]|uniref:hypothetical protein n=1 Tax=Promicromonospora sp. MEB111 TaxID=3040301 RepID=UPI00254EA5FB|nr:hypothetical protein [Promicromonospora sp. MEB111]
MTTDRLDPTDTAEPDDEDLGPKHPAFAAHFRDPIYDDEGDDFAPFGNDEGWDTLVEAAKRVDELDGSTTLVQIDPEWFEDEAAVAAGLDEDDMDMADFTIGAGFALLRLTGQIDDVGRGLVLRALDARDRLQGPQPETERLRADLLSFDPD